MPIRFEIEPVPPFRLDLTVWTLRRRANNTVDRWDGQTYRRALLLHGSVAEVEVHQTAPPDNPRLEVAVLRWAKSAWGWVQVPLLRREPPLAGSSAIG